jgi:hypothetical protein
LSSRRRRESIATAVAAKGERLPLRMILQC